MMMTMTNFHKRLLFTATALIAVLFVTGIVFSQQIQIFGIYLFLGFRAPISLRYACAQETQRLVAKKFEAPLNFDQKSKDGLRLFWHYSFYQGCLHNHGYDQAGKKIPPSTFANGVYTNTLGGFRLRANSVVVGQDNQVDVTLDDRLMVSHLVWEGKSVVLSFYKKFDNVETDSQRNATCQTAWQGRPVLLSGTDLNVSECNRIMSTIQPS
jgi:hypothetical protein